MSKLIAAIVVPRDGGNPVRSRVLEFAAGIRQSI